MKRSSNVMIRKIIPRAVNLVAWIGDNLTSDYYDDSFSPEMAYGGDGQEYGGIRHFEAIKKTP